MKSDTILIIMNLTLSILDVTIFTYAAFSFMSHVKRNLYRPKWMYCLGSILFATVVVIGTSLENIWLAMFLFAMAMVVAGRCLFSSLRIQMLNNLIFVTCVLLLLVTVVSQLIFIISAKTGFLRGNLIALGCFIMVVKQLIILLATRLFILFFNRHSAVKLKRLELINYLLLPIFSIAFVGTLIAFASTIYLSFFDAVLFVANMILIIVLNIYFSYVFDAVSRKNELESEFTLYEQQAQSQYKYYKMLEEKQENYRKVIHDMRNHLITIEQMYKDGNSGAEEYMEDMHQLLNSLGQTYYTGNRELNIILNDKAQLADSLDIRMEYILGEIDLSAIKAIDQTIIFANLLDNAVEAIQRESVKNSNILKVVQVKMEQIRGFLVVQVRNPSASPKKTEHGFISSKSGKRGIGLENVKQVVEHYDGTLVADWNDGWFEVSVTLPNIKGGD